MTNKEIKKYRGVFKKLEIPIYVENFGESPNEIVKLPYVMLRFDENNNLNLKFNFYNDNNCEFNMIFKGIVVKDNNLINIYNKHNYFILFNKLCKGSYKYKLNNIQLGIVKELGIECISFEELKILLELLFNKYIIKKKVKLCYHSNVELIRYNENIYLKYFDKLKTEIIYKLSRKKENKETLYRLIRKNKILNNELKYKILEMIYKF